MPHYSKKYKQEWAFFISQKTGHVKYNNKCKRCIHECKQSYKTKIIVCPNYEKKEAASNEFLKK